MFSWLLQINLLVVVISRSFSKRSQSQTYYMDGKDCNQVKSMGGAVVYSHSGAFGRTLYRDNLDCRLTFRAERTNWKLMLSVVQLDIPDRSAADICNDGIYVYDGGDVFSRPVTLAGGAGGLCGKKLPPTIYTTGSYLTIHFRTDHSGPRGFGFQLVVTSFNEDYNKFHSCGDRFHCANNNKCISRSLVCDSVDNCGDKSDESGNLGESCSKNGESAFAKFFSIGITASLTIAIGSMVLIIVCVTCVICYCRRCFKKSHPDPTKNPATIINSPPPVFPSCPSIDVPPSYVSYQQNYAAINGLRYQNSMSPLQQIQQVPHPIHAAPVLRPFMHRGSQCGGSSLRMSQSPPPFSFLHHPCTPPSSRSGRSHHSSDNIVMYTFDRHSSEQPVHV